MPVSGSTVDSARARTGRAVDCLRRFSNVLSISRPPTEKFAVELVSEVVPKALTAFVQNDIGCLTASLIVVCRSIFRYCYVYRRTILPQTGARRLLRQALHSVPDQAGRPAGAAHCPAGEADTRFPARPLRQIQLSRLHHRPRWGDVGTGGRSSPPRRGRERHTRPQVRRRAEPHAVGAWLAVQVMAHNLARWTARIGLGEGTVITKTLRRRVFALVGRITRSARRLTLHLPRRWPWETQFGRALARLQAIPFPA